MKSHKHHSPLSTINSPLKRMRLLVCLISCLCSVAHGQTCKPSSIPATTPDSQLTDNGDGTITDTKTGLMWKKCVEGLSGTDCATGTADTFTWQQALEQPGTINNGTGFAGYHDWRLPNIKELTSIVEEQCFGPAINLSYFANATSWEVWSGTPDAFGNGYTAWEVSFGDGNPGSDFRDDVYHRVRLVRGGQ